MLYFGTSGLEIDLCVVMLWCWFNFFILNCYPRAWLDRWHTLHCTL